MGKRIRTLDWAKTPMGPLHRWPRSLRSIVDMMLASNIPMYLCYGPDLTCLYNDPARAFLGTRHPDVLAQPLATFWPDSVSRHGKALRATLAGTAQHFEDVRAHTGRRARPGGWYTYSWIPLRNESGKVEGFISIGIETTDKVVARRSLSASEERFRLIVENVHDHAIMTMDLQGRITTWNPAAERIFGYKAREVVGQHLRQLFTPEDQAKRQPEEELALAREHGQNANGRWHVRKNGERFWASEVTCAIRTDNLNARGFTKVVRDETKARLLAEARERLLQQEQAALRDAQHAAAIKDEFLAVVSHELRTPLAAILLWARMLKSGMTTAAQQHEAYESILRSAEGQKRLVDDLLDVSRMISGHLRLRLRTCDPAVLVRAALRAIRVTAQARQVRLSLSVAPGLPRIKADPDRIQQVVWCLLHNAVKFTEPNGSVRVRVGRAGDMMEIRVADTGCGIRAEFLPHVFERFRQADTSRTRAHDGLGLGLAISQQLVELHGGTIRAHSDGPGHGSTFTVLLPQRLAASARRPKVKK